MVDKIGIKFKDTNLLREAFTHRSYLNENPDWKGRNNERLEFLGDAVLELAVTQELFGIFPEKEEGELTIYRAALVNAGMLSRVARDISLNSEILTSKGEAKELSEGRGETILSDSVEALIGAIYIDSGYDPAYQFIKKFILKYLDEVVKSGGKDAKSLIQEIAQERHAITPTYEVLEETGPAHQRTFKVGLYFGDALKAEGIGNSKKTAELEAAQKLIDRLKSGNNLL